MLSPADAVYSALSHPMRLRTLILLHQAGERCVCELTQALNVAQPIISRHLAQLKKAELVDTRRQGVWIYYRVNSELPEWTLSLINTTSNGVSDTSPYKDDLANLTAIANSTHCS